MNCQISEHFFYWEEAYRPTNGSLVSSVADWNGVCERRTGGALEGGGGVWAGTTAKKTTCKNHDVWLRNKHFANNKQLSGKTRPKLTKNKNSSREVKITMNTTKFKISIEIPFAAYVYIHVVFLKWKMKTKSPAWTRIKHTSNYHVSGDAWHSGAKNPHHKHVQRSTRAFDYWLNKKRNSTSWDEQSLENWRGRWTVLKHPSALEKCVPWPQFGPCYWPVQSWVGQQKTPPPKASWPGLLKKKYPPGAPAKMACLDFFLGVLFLGS